MTLEGANKLKEEANYTIYAVNSTSAGQYFVGMPNNSVGTCNMIVDLHKKGVLDEVANGTKTKEDLANILGEEYAKVYAKYPNALLIIPMMDEEEFKNVVSTLDKQKMFDETKKISSITSELYKKLTENGMEKQSIDQKIMIISQKEEDTKFVDWLKNQMPNFVEEINIEEKKEEPGTSPVDNNIFGAPQQSPAPTPVAFENTNPTPVPTPETPSPTSEPTTSENSGVDIFGIPNSQPASPAQESVQQPVVETPKPVQNVELEGTTTFSPLPNQEQNPTPAAPEVQPIENHKNGGFVNLAILLVILVVVTIASIELGKFLYSVYGA